MFECLENRRYGLGVDLAMLRACVTWGGLRGFKNPHHADSLALCLLLTDQDVNFQLLHQNHAYLFSAIRCFLFIRLALIVASLHINSNYKNSN